MRSAAGRMLMAVAGAGVHVQAAFNVATLTSNTVVPANGGNAVLTSPSFTPNPGELLVLKTIGWDNTITTPVTPTGGGLVWTQRLPFSSAASATTGGIWTATAPASPTAMTVSCQFNNSATATGIAAIVVERWAGTLAATPATAILSGDTASPYSTTLTNTVSGSAITWCGAEYNGIATAGTAYLSGAVQTYPPTVVSSGGLTVFNAWQRTASVGAQTFGLTVTAAAKITLFGLEVLGT